MARGDRVSEQDDRVCSRGACGEARPERVRRRRPLPQPRPHRHLGPHVHSHIRWLPGATLRRDSPTCVLTGPHVPQGHGHPALAPNNAGSERRALPWSSRGGTWVPSRPTPPGVLNVTTTPRVSTRPTRPWGRVKHLVKFKSLPLQPGLASPAQTRRRRSEGRGLRGDAGCELGPARQGCPRPGMGLNGLGSQVFPGKHGDGPAEHLGVRGCGPASSQARGSPLDLQPARWGQADAQLGGLG